MRAKALPKQKPYADMTIDDVRALIKEVKEEGEKIQSHYKKMEEYYSAWEDKLNKVEQIINQITEDTGIDREEIIAPESEQLIEI